MNQVKMNAKSGILLPGIIGSIGALLIFTADIVYNLFDGRELGPGLYISAYLGVFCFSFWWAGIWVIYKGLKPAGFIYSFPPCLLLAFSQSTISVFRHSSYIYKAVIRDAFNTQSSEVLQTVTAMESNISQYTGFMNVLPGILELTVMIWLAIPITRGKTCFPRWIVLLFPVFPMMLSAGISIWFKGFFNSVEPYLPSGCMSILFILCTSILYQKAKQVEV